MEKITKYFKYSYENDTTVEYVSTGLYSMLNCSFTSEDPDYGTDTLHSDPANPPKHRDQMAYEMAQEIAAYLDATEDGIYRKNGAPYEEKYGDFSNSTLYAIEKALKGLAGDYKPDTKQRRTIMMSKEPALEIETTLGTIQIKKSGFTAEGYPGFVFSIERNGKCTDIALLEVDENTYEEMPEPTLKVHVWGPGKEDPVFDQWLTGKQLDRMYEEGK